MTQHIVNPHVGDKYEELLFGSYPESIIEEMDKYSKSSNIADIALSGFYTKMKNDIMKWYIRFREQER